MSENNAETLLSLETLIKNNVASIDTLKEEVQKHAQILKDACEGDVVYREHLKIANDSRKVLLKTKQSILKQPSNVQLSRKIKGMRQELKDKKEALSEYLLEYQKQTGVNQLELFNGEVLEIVNTAKVLRVRK